MPSVKIPQLNEIYRGSIPFVESNTIFCALHGSHAYNLATETSDIDIKGVLIAPLDHYLGFSKTFEQAEGREPYDLSIFEIKKFFKLAAQCNPNIIEILYTEPSEHVFVSPIGQKLIDNRDAFLSMKARHTFAGYAKSQLHRINSHYKWLKNPPLSAPERKDFGLDEKSRIPKEQLGAALTEVQKKMESFDFNWDVLEEADRVSLKSSISNYFAEISVTTDEQWVGCGRSLGFDENFIEILKNERSYKAKKDEWDQYQHWIATRNPKRAAIEAKYGFDLKHASHLVRLLKMCREIVETGKVIVKRVDDREELLAIKNHGHWTYEQTIEWADAQEKEIAKLAQTSIIIPKAPNMEFLDNLCMEFIQEFHTKKS